MTTWRSDDDGHADLSNHDSFVNGLPLNTFARLRRDDPCAWTEYKDGVGFWSVTRHADISELNRNTELMSSARGIRMEDQTYEEYLARRTFQETDPPDHTRHRMLLAKAFSAPVVRQFEGQIRELCNTILNRAFATSEIEGVSAIARELPMRVLGQILGLPEKDLDWLVSRGDQLMANSDPDFTTHVVDKVDTDAFRLMPFRSPAGAELYTYAATLIAEHEKTGSSPGILGMLLEKNADAGTMSRREFQNFFCLAVAAGNDTTRYSISSALYAMANRPQILRDMQSGNEAVWETAPDEFIRWASPATYFRRTATRDFELHGRTIRRDDKVLLWFCAGNRDEEAFDIPNEVDIARARNRHLAFGQGGPHVCLGMWLARLELRVMLQSLAQRLKSVTQTGPHAYVRSNFVGGIKRLPLRVTLQ